MSEWPQRQLDAWISLVYELVQVAHTTFPIADILALLDATYGAVPSQLVVSAATNMMHLTMLHPPSGWPPASIEELWEEVPWWEHPVTSWYLASGDLTPQTVHRVPSSVASRDVQGALQQQLQPFGLHRQLAIPVSISGDQRFLIVSGDGADFTPSQLRFALQVQPLLMLLQRHVDACRSAPDVGDEVGLTARELVVLGLLCEGLTAASIALRLGCSPRTVSKHLENTCRKLGVRDRLSAVRIAEMQGLVHADREAVTIPAQRQPADDILVMSAQLRAMPPGVRG